MDQFIIYAFTFMG